MGWGAHLDCRVASGLWDTRQAALSINARDLLAVQLGLFQFRSALRGGTVAVFCDDTTAVHSLRKGGGTWSPLLNTLAPAILRWMESISIRLPPQFLPGSDNVLTDSLSRPHQLPHPEWSIHMTVFLFLRRLWPVQIVSLQSRPLIVVWFASPLSGIRGQQARMRFSSSGTTFRLTRSIRWLSSTYYREAPGLHGDGTHSCGSPLGSVPLVFGPGPALAGSPSDPTVPSRPPALDSVSSSLPGSPLAQASCLATLQRFPRAAGFSSAIAEQSSMARRPSSRAVSQVRWSIYHGWYPSNGHYISNPTFAMVADSCVTYGTPEALVCPPCMVTVQFYLRFSVFTFRPCLRIRCFGFVPLLPTLFSGVCATSPYLGLVYGAAYLVSPAFEPLSLASFRALPLTTLFLLALATAKMGWGATGSLFHSHLCGWGWMPFLHPAVCRQVGVAHQFHPSLLLGDVLSRLCGWSWFRPPTMPGQGSPLVSASGQVFVYRSPSPFRVPSAPCSPFSTNAVSFFFGGGHRCCSGG